MIYGKTKNSDQWSVLRGQQTDHRPLTTGHSQFGFTLLEVIVAISIIATSLVALLSLQSRSIRMMESAEMLEGARMLSEKLMGEGELKGVPGGEAKGEEGPYKWILAEVRITREAVPEGVPALPGRQLSLDLSWKEGGRDEKLSFAEYIYEK